MKAVEKYFKPADEALKTAEIVTNGKADSEFKGYISAFGASVIMSGLLPALAFYINEESGAAKERPKIAHAIAIVLGQPNGKKLLEQAINLSKNNPTQFEVLKTNIVNVAIALKLMLRTYQLN